MELTRNKPFLLHLFAGALVLTSVISVLLGWHILDSYSESRRIQSRDIRIISLSWIVFHRDEILSMSVHRATQSELSRWEQHYREFLPQVNSALAEMPNLKLEDHEQEAVSNITETHVKLNAIEESALELIRLGQKDAALELLSGKEYERLEQLNIMAINNLVASVIAGMHTTLDHQHRQARAVAIVMAVTLPVLFISWVFVLRTIRKYLRERDQAESSLRKSESNYRELVQSANSIILRMDSGGKVTFFNDFAQHFFGYREEEILGRSVMGTIVPMTDASGRDLFILIDQVLGDPDRFASSENENIRKNGERVWVSWTNRSIRDEQGRITGVLSIGNDITERKRAEEALKEQYSFLQHLIDVIPSPIFYKNANGLYQGCNKAFESFIGFTKDEIVGKTVFDVSPEELARKYHQMDSALFEKPGTQVYESAVQYADGTRHVVIFNKASYFNSEGNVAGLVGVMVDITERRQMEEDLRIDEARFEALFALSQMHGRSAEEIIEFALARQVELTGSENGFMGFMNANGSELDLHAWSSNVADQCGICDEAAHLPIAKAGLWADAVRQGQPVINNDYNAPYPERKGCPQGHIKLTRFMGVPLIENGRVVAVVAVANKNTPYNSSDVRQLSLFLDGVWTLIQRRKTEQELRQAESLAAMGEALSSVAHDFKTPLIAIGGFSRLVQQHMEPESPDWEKLGIVVRETHRLEKMVKDMLEFSKPLDLQRTIINIDEVIMESLLLVNDFAREKEISIRVVASETPFMVPVDTMRMKQALVNLVMNAIQASPEGATVMIRVQPCEKGMIIDVIDSGHGIPPNKREEVFSPFYTTRKEGTGLGLPIVKKIINAHGGHVRIIDNTGSGLIFRIEVPIP